MSDPWGLILAATITGLLTYLATRLTKPKISAESESIAVATMERALQTSNNRITALEKAMMEVRKELASVLEQRDKAREERDQYAEGTDILRGQVRELGGNPRWPK